MHRRNGFKRSAGYPGAIDWDGPEKEGAPPRDWSGWGAFPGAEYLGMKNKGLKESPRQEGKSQDEIDAGAVGGAPVDVGSRGRDASQKRDADRMNEILGDAQRLYGHGLENAPNSDAVLLEDSAHSNTQGRLEDAVDAIPSDVGKRDVDQKQPSHNPPGPSAK